MLHIINVVWNNIIIIIWCISSYMFFVVPPCSSFLWLAWQTASSSSNMFYISEIDISEIYISEIYIYEISHPHQHCSKVLQSPTACLRGFLLMNPRQMPVDRRVRRKHPKNPSQRNPKRNQGNPNREKQRRLEVMTMMKSLTMNMRICLGAAKMMTTMMMTRMTLV